MYAKNEKINLDIVDITNEGLGVAKVDGQVFFVKNAVIGDKITAIITKNDGKGIIFAKTINIIERSKYRVEEKCNIAMSCGGCQMMALDYKEQLRIKADIVKNNLKRIGGFNNDFIEDRYEGIVGMDTPYYFRNKMQIPFAVRDNRVICGFYAERTHYVVECEKCITGFEEASKLISIIKKVCIAENDNLNIVKNFIKPLTIYNEKEMTGMLREVLIRKGNNSHEISITLIVNDKNVKNNIDNYKNIAKFIIEEYKCLKGDISQNMELSKGSYNDINVIRGSQIKTITLNINTSNNNVLFGKENIILYGDGFIEDTLCGLKFHISPESFYQVNSIQTEKLYNEALRFIKEKSDINNALDLFSGIGTITLLLSKYVKNIVGLEIVKKAVENAKNNAKINGIKNAKFICADAMDINNLFIENNYDLISVDPPRKGLDKNTIDFMIKTAPKYILYISCDSATLSRDLKILCNNQKVCYNIERIKCIDMFPHTMHVETIVLLSMVKL